MILKGLGLIAILIMACAKFKNFPHPVADVSYAAKYIHKTPRPTKTCEENYPGETPEELVDRIPLDKTYKTFVPLYKVNLSVTPGQRILLVLSMEITNDLGYPVMLGYGIRRTLNGTTDYVYPRVGTNITQEQHHYGVHVTQIDHIKESGDVTYEVIGYAASSGELPGEFLNVEQCYGKFEAEII